MVWHLCVLLYPQVEAGTVNVQLLSGDYRFAVSHLSATLFEGASVDQPAGTLLVLPFARLPTAHFRLKTDWKLPNGRSPEQHHLFPHVPLGGGQRQTPIVVSAACSLCLEVLDSAVEQERRMKLVGGTC